MSHKNKSLTLSDLYGYYLKFWTIFLNVTGKAQLVVTPRNPPFKVEMESSTIANVSLNHSIHLKNWPHKSSNNSLKDLHIIIDAIETIDLGEHNITKSWVKVIYFQEQTKEKDKLLPIESIHYDYEAKPKSAHPVFHAQFCQVGSDIERTKKVETLEKYELLNNNLADRNGFKIPTAHMNIISVLICLCADHIPVSSSVGLKDLIDGIKDIDNMIMVKADSLSSNIKENNSFCSKHWYDI